MFSKAKWLSIPADVYGAYTRSHFHIPKSAEGKRAILRIVGLGYFRPYINGYALSEELYLTPFSDYCERDLRHTFRFVENTHRHSIYYNEFDITNLVNDYGKENLLFCELGCGWFKNNDRYCEGDFSFSKNLMLLFEVLVDGEVVAYSDENTLWHDNGIVKEGLYTGMTFDFSKEIADAHSVLCNESSWYHADTAADLSSKLIKNDCKGDRILGYIEPRLIISGEGYAVYDCDINTVGYFTCKASDEQGRITVEYAELCGENDILGMYETIPGFEQSQIDTYLHVPQGANCAPRFTWYGFRYVKVTGDVEDCKVVCTGTKIEELTSFRSSDPVLNWYEKTAKHSLVTNFHMGLITDCPHREKYPYTGDGSLVSKTMMFNYGIRAEYRKWLWDMEDAQRSTGMIPNTVPNMGGGGGPGAWGSACILVAWNYYQMYGDKSVLADHFRMMKRYLKGLIKMTVNGIVCGDRERTPFLGDWSFPVGHMLPEEFVNTYYLIKCLQVYKEICSVIDKPFESDLAMDLASVQTAWKKAYFNPETGSFLNGNCAADAFAVDVGLGDDRTAKNLVAKYSKMNRFDTGIFGTELLFSVLERLGESQVIYDLLSTKEYPSFGHWKEQGATTLWEDWNGEFFTSPGTISSRNHAMYAASQPYLYSALAGIKFDGKGFCVIPRRVIGLEEIKAQVNDGNGHFVLVEIRNGSDFTTIRIHSNTEYKLILNGREQRVSGDMSFDFDGLLLCQLKGVVESNENELQRHTGCVGA